jgi:hypothetical protein
LEEFDVRLSLWRQCLDSSVLVDAQVSAHRLPARVERSPLVTFRGVAAVAGIG